MKLIIQNDRIVATATDEYVGPETAINEPNGFDAQRLSEYRVIDGALVLPGDTDPRLAMVCTPWAMCKALNRLALLETVESAIAASNDIDLKYGWARAQEFKRLDGFVLTMQSALGKSDELMDELFELAMSL